MPEGASGGYVLFRVAEETFGLPIERVQSIIRYERGTPVPRAPEVVEGVINLRGRIVPVVDLMRRLGRGAFTPGPTARIVVVEGEGGLVGLAVDAASEVVRIETEAIQPAPAAALSADTAYAFEGVVEFEGALVILLDLDQAVPKAEYASALEQGAPEEGGEDG